MLITRRVSGAGTPGDFIWVQRDMHFCSFIDDRCLTLVNRTTIIKEEAVVTLAPYNKSDPSQMWVKKGGELRQIVETINKPMCLTFEVPTAPKENLKLPNESPVRAKLCGANEMGQIWDIVSLPDKKEHRQRLLELKNSNSNIVKP